MSKIAFKYPCVISIRLATTSMMVSFFWTAMHLNGLRQCGASEINMSFMIEEEDVEEAVKSLHATFFQDPDPDIFDVEARQATVFRN